MQNISEARNKSFFSHDWKSLQSSFQVNLRKKKRSDHISSKRLANQFPSDTFMISSDDPTTEYLESLKQSLTPTSPDLKQISIYLQNLAYKGEKDVKKLTDLGYIHLLHSLLLTVPDEISENLLGCLINISATGPVYRRKVASEGILKTIPKMIYFKECSVSLLKTVALTLRNLVQADVQFDSEEIDLVINTVKDLISFDFPKMNLSCLFVMQALTYVGIVQQFIEDQSLNFLFAKASDQDLKIALLALEVLDNFVIDSNKFIKLLLDRGIVSLLEKNFQSEDSGIVKKAALILGHFIECPPKKNQQLFKSSVFFSFIPVISHYNETVRRESSFVLFSLSSYSKTQDLSQLFHQLYDRNIIFHLAQALDTKNDCILRNLLVFIDRFLKVLTCEFPFLRENLKDCDLQSALANSVIICKDSSREVSSRIITLLDEYFTEQQDEEYD